MSDCVVRRVRPEDVPAVVSMVHELAEFERMAHECYLTEEQLHAVLFPATSGAGTANPGRGEPALFGHVAVNADTDEPVGFALWFLNFSTWEGVHGIWLEDLYVRPAARGAGAGQALLAALAGICTDRGYRRLDWWVLDWNEKARRMRGSRK